MEFMEIIGEYRDLVSKIEITNKKLFVYLKSNFINTTELNSISNELSKKDYNLDAITTDDDNNLLIVFEYVKM